MGAERRCTARRALLAVRVVSGAALGVLPALLFVCAGTPCAGEMLWLREQVLMYTFSTSVFDVACVALASAALALLPPLLRRPLAAAALALGATGLAVAKAVAIADNIGRALFCSSEAALVLCIASAILCGAVAATAALVDAVRQRRRAAADGERTALLEAGGSSGAAATAAARGTSLRRVLGLAKPFWPSLALGLLCLVVGSLATLAIPAYFGKVLDSVVASRSQQLLVNAVLELFAVVCISSAASFVRAWMFTRAGEQVVAALRKRLFSVIMQQEVPFFDTSRTGDLLNRLSSDTAAIQNAATVNISITVRYLFQIVGAIVVLFIISWDTTLIMLAVVPIVVLGAVLYGKFLQRLRKRYQDALADSNSTAEESIGSVRTVKSFAQEEQMMAKFDEKIELSLSYGKSMALAGGVFQGAAGIAAQSALAVVLYYGGLRVLDGTLSAGQLISFLFYTLQVALSFALLSSTYGDFMSAVGASTRTFELIDRVPSMNYDGGERLADVRGHVKFDHVSFNYPSRPDQVVLRDISLQLSPGQILAVVGSSGGGKSTLVSLIERFYDPLEGAVTMDGSDVRRLDPKWMRRNIGLVSQEPVLFACSIRENIAYGRPDASLEEIVEAAKKANAHTFIESFSEKYDTVVGERGVRLSGGQKQRVAIARALLLDPRVLLLDEATSALDSESEALVQEAIDRLMVGRTVLVIAHRLSTVQTASQILVMDSGQIAEKGTHDELMARNGIYKQLVQRQLQERK